MKDNLGNDIRELRIYICSEGDYDMLYEPELKQDELRPLTDEEIIRLSQFAAGEGIKCIRLTGKETLKREGITELISKIKGIDGIEKVALNTKGALLTSCAKELKEAGLDEVSVELDTLKYTAYTKLTDGGSLDDIIPGINACVDAELSPVNIETHIFEGVNDSELMDFLQLTFQHRYNIIFKELPKGAFGAFKSVTTDMIKSRMPALRSTLPEGETLQPGEMEYFKYPSTLGKLGFISPASDPEHAGAGIANIDAYGRLQRGLFSEESESIDRILE